MVMPYSHSHSWKPGRNLKLSVVLLLVLLIGVYAWWAVSTDTQLVDDLNFLNVNGLPLAFVPNVGQSDPAVKFQAQSGASSLFLTQDGLTMVWPVAGTEEGENEAGNAAALSMHFLDVNPNLDVMTGKALPGTVNYLRGNKAPDWHTNVATYGAVTYQQLYPGVDLHYGGQASQLTYTFEVAPGVDPEMIRWSYDDNVSVSVDETTGDLVLSINVADAQNPITLVKPLPTAWQMMDGNRQPVETRYSLKEDGAVGLKIEDRQIETALFIEERMGTSLIGLEYGNAIAVDSVGNIYLAGTTFTSDFPTVNPIQTWQGSSDVFVTKLSPDGSSIIFSTLLGGSNSEHGYAIAVDDDNHVYVAGLTSSENFPTQNPFQATLSATVIGTQVDGFLTKLATDGTGLIYSTFLGGNYLDHIYALAVDSMGNAYVTGDTSSDDFPLLFPYQTTNQFGTPKAFVTKFNPDGSTLAFSTYLGGTQGDSAYGIAVDQTNTIFIAGSTRSSDFPLVNPYQSTLEGESDGFVTRMSADGSDLIYSTYLGGGPNPLSNSSSIQDIAVDEIGNAYLIGTTNSPNFPLVNPFQNTLNGPRDSFITKINPTGTALIYSTYFGGNAHESGQHITIDANNQVYVAGLTSSTDFPTVNPVQANYAGSSEIFVSKLSSNGSILMYSTYLGGSSRDLVGGIAVNQAGQAYIIGDTDSIDFPTVNPIQAQLIGPTDVIIAGFTQNGSALQFSTYLGGSGYPPTDVTLTGVEGSNPFSNVWLWVVMGVILVVGAWVTRPRTRKPRSVE